MPDLTIWTRKGTKMPSPANSFTLAAADPTAVNKTDAALEALGRVPDSGIVVVEMNAGATISLRVFSLASNAWRYPGADAASYQKAFAAAGIDFFEAPPGALFHLRSATGTPTGYHSGDRV